MTPSGLASDGAGLGCGEDVQHHLTALAHDSQAGCMLATAPHCTDQILALQSPPSMSPASVHSSMSKITGYTDQYQTELLQEKLWHWKF